MSRSANLLLGLIAATAVFSSLSSSGLAQQTPPVQPISTDSRLGLGRLAHPDEIKAWDTDIRPDGMGLPTGKGTAKQGDDLFQTQCAACHGEFGQGVDRWPVLAGGHESLKSDRPDKTIGSFWPEVSTLFDYTKRAMPFGNAQSLSNDDVYALVAYLLLMNDVIKDETFELNETNFTAIKLPNASAFYDDDRETNERDFWNKSPCMTDCRPAPRVLGRATLIDVTPDNASGQKMD